ncbi:MAG: sigma-70 family RNA polymerase sigma factor [Lachnospiraceae bacterium]|nr:sigma-70 family RNA polymerase sigma factor [Lachnospiraceae bacterium]
MKHTYELSVIIRELLSGNRKAFQELYNLTANDVYFHVKTIVNNDAEAARLIVKIYKSMAMRLDRLQKPEDAVKWMNKIMYGHLMDWMNVHCATMLMDEEMGRFDKMPAVPIVEGGMTMYTEAETAALAATYVSQLPEVHAITGLAYFFDNLEMQETAELLQCDETRIATRTKYAQKLVESYCKDFAKENNIEIQTVDTHILLLAYVLLAKEAVLPGMRELYFDIAQEIS